MTARNDKLTEHSSPLYHRRRFMGRTVYIKPAVVTQLRDIQAIIFDCDGVLIDTRRSYTATIIRTVRFLLDALVGVTIPARVVTPSIVETLRKSGGFNNDWNSTYVIALYLVSCLPRPYLEEFLQGRHARQRLSADAERLHDGLYRFVAQANTTGLGPLESILMQGRQPRYRLQALHRFKQLVQYPEQGAHSLLATIFDEIFYGPDLFQRVHRQPAQYYTGRGAIDNERPIITDATLKQLTKIVGTPNLGIASGRGTVATRYTLGAMFDAFNPRARILLEDDELNTHADVQTLRAERAKPAPYSLLAAAQAMNPFKRALYVGDSAEDFIMTRRANQHDPRYLFAGVTDSSHDPKAKRMMFVEAMADVILPSVNELPIFLQAVRA
ncbi:MAG: hypothetical protein RMM98_14110 [Acidobacteriota bacterium]|nr:hypothetical protein [Blastocatellia bacterium]MDW8240740.1 hypothetical protein [Acidobacteriota bacterium]